MKNLLTRCEIYAPSVLRYGMATVILWFGLQQVFDVSAWTAYIPDSIVGLTHLDAATLVMFNGIFELVFGIALLIGFQVRTVALLLSLHLFDIMFTVGYGEIAVRDFGLALATLVVFMNGSDILCIQHKKVEAQTINQ